eukprot:CAMPEP_0183456464 /NCGR_PEP_ID=MMETSP0370-20130417/129064_1 /TAXON_ID=268820 /ORGANISM="Peridinium aciculiferum, Strain PAER-2" /LENGTH=78 /DNA_ID=CAMNT_0025648109 /DNA_START=110 /DNA_END=346 /DNA_ORIENTATION=-
MEKHIATSPSKSSAVANLAWHMSLLAFIDVASVPFGSVQLTEVESAIALCVPLFGSACLASQCPRLLQVWPVDASATW